MLIACVTEYGLDGKALINPLHPGISRHCGCKVEGLESFKIFPKLTLLMSALVGTKLL